MPADSRTLDEEGVVIPPSRLDDELLAELAARMRNPAQRRADLRAQLAANRTGARASRTWRRRTARDLLREAMDATLDYAERRTRARIAELPDGDHTARTCSRHPTATSSCGCAPRSRATSSSSTSRAARTQHDGNLNCPLAVTLSACYFAVRVLADPDVPPSAGAWRPVTVERPRARC